VEFRYSDDFMPAWFEDLPAPPIHTAGFLGVAWLSLGVYTVYRTKSNRKHEQIFGTSHAPRCGLLDVCFGR
jgi:hypothetical protein